MGFLCMAHFLILPGSVVALISGCGFNAVPMAARTRLFATTEKRLAFRLVVTYDGQRCELDAYPDETVLAALERNSVMDSLCLPNIPADCRRGNCMTCAGRLLGTHNPRMVQSDADGLSPHVSDLLRSSDYILTCSSFIKGDGVEILLGENSRLWEEMYHRRFVSEESRTTKMETVAKLHRLRAENNVPRWTAETEQILEKSGDDESNGVLENDV
jgi:ferredoxin